MVRSLVWLVPAVVACTSNDVDLAARYTDTSTPTCMSSPFDLARMIDGSLTIFGNGTADPFVTGRFEVGLTADGAGAYRSVVAACETTDVPCVGPCYQTREYLVYTEIDVNATSADTVHVAFASALVLPSSDCSMAAALAIADQATRCEADAVVGRRAPAISSITPTTIPNTYCPQELTIHGTNFMDGVRVGYITEDNTCPSSWPDRTAGNACDLVVDSTTPTTITAHLAVCPPRPDLLPAGPLELAVMNPDAEPDALLSGQEAYVAVQFTP